MLENLRYRPSQRTACDPRQGLVISLPNGREYHLTSSEPLTHGLIRGGTHEAHLDNTLWNLFDPR